MTSQTSPSSDEQVGEWLREELLEHFDPVEEPWAVDLARRTATRLNDARAPAPPLEPVLLWIAMPLAFIGPGRYLYVTHGLLHRAWWEDAVAFAMAHEMAHHDLGDTAVFARLGWAERLPGAVGLAAFLALGERLISGPERESAADALAFELCLDAGYDGPRCVAFFDVMAAYMLDHGDVDGVYGPELVEEPPEPPLERLRSQAREWLWQHLRGYPSIHARKHALLARLQSRPPTAA